MTEEATNLVSILKPRADRIRKLMESMVTNTLAIGDELDKARESFEIGPKGQRMGWKTWLRDEFNINVEWAQRLILAHHKFHHRLVANKPMPTKTVLDYLALDHVPEEGSSEVLDRVQRGEKIGKNKAKKIVAKHRPPPKRANEIARETGKPVEASDGYVYFGATAEQAKETQLRRTMVFSVREAITTLAGIELHPNEFLEFALPHQLWRVRDERQIKDALGWLKALDVAWDRRKS